MCAAQVPGDTYRNLQIHPVFSAQTFKHILVPVWLLTYNFGAKSYQVVVNGVTGRMAGDYPKSPWKIALLVLAAIIVCLDDRDAWPGLIGCHRNDACARDRRRRVHRLARRRRAARARPRGHRARRSERRLSPTTCPAALASSTAASPITRPSIALFAASRFDYVYHLAAYAAEGLSHFIKRFNYTNNVIGSVNLINAAVNTGVKGFVFTSSIAVYGRSRTCR